MVEARIGEFERQRILPIDPGTDRVRCLPVREVLGELEDGHEGQPPRGGGGLAPRREQVREVRVLVEGVEVIPHAQVRGPEGKGSTGDAGRFL